MQRITLRQARPGMTLARGVLDPGNGQQVLLEHGVRLTTRAIVCLHEAGVFDLWVNWPGLEQFEDFAQATFSDSQRRLGEALRQGFINQSEILAVSPLAFSQLDESASLLARPVFEAAAQCVSLEECMASNGETVLRHGAEVALLTLALARRLETYIVQERRWTSTRPMRDLTSLALGCLFHDLGEVRLPSARRAASADALGTDAPPPPGDSWMKHPQVGYEMIRRQIDPVAASMVLHHHRHFDGTGFDGSEAAAGGTEGRRQHIFWRLLMATDTLDHLRQLDGVPMPMVYALSQIQKAPYAQWVDPVILQALLEVVPAFVPGMLVRLSNGRSGVVEYCDLTMPCCPVVRLLPLGLGQDGAETETSGTEPERDVIDLRYNGSCWVQAVDGTEVADYLYGRMPERHSPEPEIP
ncbi:MAG: HD domain-containing protein, partial [Phycisphaerae bacterium]